MGGFLANASASEQFLERLFKHSFSQAWLEGIRGGNMKHGLMAGMASVAGGEAIMEYAGNASRAVKTALNAVVAGTASEFGGGKFTNGAMTGAFVMMFNELEHQEKKKDIVIPADKGGFIEDRDDFIDYMYDMAKNHPDEVSGFELKDGRYYVEPYNENTPIRSITEIDNIPGYKRGDVVAQYHTHPNSSGGSIFDAQFSASYGKPVYTMGANGNAFKIFYSIGMIVPRYGYIQNGKYYGLPYGTPVNLRK